MKKAENDFSTKSNFVTTYISINYIYYYYIFFIRLKRLKGLRLFGKKKQQIAKKCKKGPNFSTFSTLVKIRSYVIDIHLVEKLKNRFNYPSTDFQPNRNYLIFGD